MKKLYPLLTVLFLLLSQLTLQAQCVLSVSPDTVVANCGDSVTFTAVGSVPIAGDDFNGSSPSMIWSDTSHGTIGTFCSPAPDGSDYMWVGLNTLAPRELILAPLDVSAGGNICFDLLFATQGMAPPCEGPDLPNEGVILQYSLDTVNWFDINFFNPNPTTGSPYVVWTNYCFSIPAAAQTNATWFRWYQAGASGSNFDHWGIDDMEITAASSGSGMYNWGHGWTSNSDTTFVVFSDTSFVVQFATGGDTCQTMAHVTVSDIQLQPTASSTLICAGDSVQLGVNPIGVDPNAAPTAFLWSPSIGLDQSNTNSPMASPPNSTTYVVTYTHPAYPVCSATDSISITVADSFSLQFASDIMQPCIGDSARLQATPSLAGTYTYQWIQISGNATLDDPTISGPLATGFNGLPNQWVVTVTSSSGCTVVDTFFLNSSASFPPSLAVSPDTTIALGDSALLSVTETSGNPHTLFSWTPTQYVSESNSSVIWAYPTVTTFFFVSGVDSTNGCTSDTEMVKVTISGISNVDEASNEPEISLYPNPSHGVLVVDPGAENYELEVHDAAGRVVHRQRANGRTTLTLQHLAAGTYYLHCVNAENRTALPFVIK